MANTFQQQPLPQQPPPPPQQPVLVYPNTPPTHQPDSHTTGSFGTVFIVLAVIIVVSGIACCLGRLCNRTPWKDKEKNKDKKHYNKKGRSQHNSKVGQGDDIEFGLPPPTFGLPMAGEREGPNGPHQKQPGETVKNGPYNPYAPSPSQHNDDNRHKADQEQQRGGGMNVMKMMNSGGDGEKKKGFGNGGGKSFEPRFKGGENYPVMEFGDGEPVRGGGGIIKIRDRQSR